ncbi:ACP phosphodiesterase [Dysgonomonas sp. ZJ709]|uniref:acyl carrier protein phosphodiesterase n=1 Tax=Dysgonomonas sp. ZJ709 TaxID=2709797 RepID=UPI0013EC3DEA|nr:ACP phosphodiesterase [Dysgonomonas sp. ZJ709]
MNFLAHAFLSFDNPDILVGNLIADMVKGKQMDVYPSEIRRGIKIHRLIDSFTDSHPVTLEAKKLFQESAGRYGSSFLDVSYDHFLALDPLNQPKEGWELFAQNCYAQIEERGNILPSIFCNMYMYMKSEDWFSNYQNMWMIERSFDRLKRRASYLDDNAPVFADFEKNYNTIQKSYELFFPDLKKYVEEIS